MFSFLKIIIYWTIIYVGVAVNLASAKDDGIVSVKKWHPYSQLSLRNDFGQNISYMEGFAPIWQSSNSLIYANLSGISNFDKIHGKGLGLGYRYIYQGAILGGYVLVDNQKTTLGNKILQTSFGTEFLTEEWDFRINYAIPESKTTLIDSGSKTVIIDNKLYGQQFRAKTMHGGNIEIGKRLPRTLITDLFHDTKLYLGSSYYNRTGIKEIISSYTSLDVKVNNPSNNKFGVDVSIGADLVWENHKKLENSVFLKIKIPFGRSQSSNSKSAFQSPLDERMNESIRRHNITVKEQLHFQEPQPITLSAGGTEAPFIYFAKENSTGSGTQQDPTDLGTAINLAGANGIVALTGDSGDVTVSSAGAFGGENMQPGQTIVGGGSYLNFTTPDGRTITYQVPGTRPTIVNTNPADYVVLNMAEDTIIRGVNIDGNGVNDNLTGMTGGSYGINADGISNYTIEDVGFRDLDIGAYISNSSGTIENSTFNGIGNWGIEYSNASSPSTVTTISNNSFSGAIGW